MSSVSAQILKDVQKVVDCRLRTASWHDMSSISDTTHVSHAQALAGCKAKQVKS